MGPDGGWAKSARGYIKYMDRGDTNRELLLDSVMLDLCGDGAGHAVLDVGCGEGRFCRMLAERGASTLGVDPTAEMVREARLRDSGGVYVRARGESLPFSDGVFDIVVSYVALTDITDHVGAINEMARVLRPGGSIVAANLGFVTASYGWERDEQGKRLYQKIDRYAEVWPQVFAWADNEIEIENWHRPLGSYMTAYLSQGLILCAFLEPVPEDESLRDHPDFEDWFRVPLFNVMRWEKPA